MNEYLVTVLRGVLLVFGVGYLLAGGYCFLIMFSGGLDPLDPLLITFGVAFILAGIFVLYVSISKKSGQISIFPCIEDKEETL